MIGSSKSIWGFDPRSVPGCSLWLDAADASQVTFSSSTNVNTWIDKSGFNNNCSNQSLGSTITYPGTKVNGLNTVNFTAGCIRGVFNGSSVINTTDVTIFIVTVETAPNNNLRMFSLTTAANYQDDTANTMLVYCAPGNYQLTFYRAGAMPTPYTVTQNVPFIYSLTQTSGTGSMWLNGGSNTTASITTSAFAVTNYNIGTQYLANQNYTGLMCEILVYNSLLTTSQRQQVEGYLAWKWGLTTYLPAISPLSIPGCQLWLDAADASTLVLSGSNVTQWNDKSGNGFNGTAVNASVGSPIAPSYVTNSINGLSAITMSGTSYFTGSTNVNSTTLTCFFIGNCVFGTGGSSQQRILGLSVTGLDDYSSTLRPIPLAVISGGTQLLSYRNANMASATVVSGTNFIGCCLFDGTSNYMYKDGTLGTQVASSGTFTTSIYGVGSDAGTQFMGFTSSLGTNCLVGKIGEILVYNTALTTTQRQSIEGYLARKWGFTSMYSALPSIHPFSSIRPHLRTFQPTDIPGCQLWLDGADQSSMTFSGSTITQWNDKSGRGISIPSTGTPTITTVNGRSSVSFNGSSYFIRSNFTGLFNSSYVSWIAVANVTNSASASYLSVVGTSYQVNNYSENQMYINSGNILLYYRGFNGDPARTDTVSLTSGTNILQTITDFRDGSYQIYQNGTGSTVRGGGPTSLATSEPINLTIGHDLYPGDTILVGTISEILLYTQPLTTAQRQQVEGYLSHKWGLTTPIPSTHPFKSIPSSSVTFSPRSISGIALWLDGADQSSMTFSGSNITQWNDKSGNGRNATATGTPTYVTGGGVNFNASSYFLNQTFSMNLSQRSIFIVMQETTRTTSAGVVSFIPNPSSGNDYSTTTGLAVETASGLRFLGNFTNGGYYLSALGNSSLLVKAIYNDSMNVTTGSGYLNGTNATNVTADYTASTCSGYTIGVRWESGSIASWSRLNGVIYEILVFNTALTTSQRQQVEGYLAQKWGLTTSLPSTHVYKKIPP